MRRRLLAPCNSLLAVVALAASAQTVHRNPQIQKFMGREVKIYAPARDDDGDPGMPPPEPAKICVEGPPQEQCYSTPQGNGWDRAVQQVELAKDKPALFFSASTGGVSGRSIHFALLVPGARSDLENLLAGDISLSNQSETAFWSQPDLSDAKIFVTATYLWGPGESHYGEHRYEISAYMMDGGFYPLADRYVTARWYDLDAKADVLLSERAEIVGRLKKVLPGIRQRM